MKDNGYLDSKTDAIKAGSVMMFDVGTNIYDSELDGPYRVLRDFVAGEVVDEYKKSEEPYYCLSSFMEYAGYIEEIPVDVTWSTIGIVENLDFERNED